jgi:nicotinate-nucleotide adenylyltransferase
MEMLRLAILSYEDGMREANTRFEVTDVELARGGVSYTIDSLRRLRDGYYRIPAPADAACGAAGTTEGADAVGADSLPTGAGTEAAAAEWFFIVGADMFLSLGKWKECGSLMKEFAFIVGRRPGYMESETDEAARDYEARYGAKAIMADNTWMDVSSSEIRRRVAQRVSVRDMTPDGVIAYIEGRGLYGQG